MASEPVPIVLPPQEPATPPMRLQILATEHWSLLASRNLAWNEAFTRAGMFLSVLSGVMVALALVAQASAFGEAFFLFALVLLPIALLVGLATFIRLGAANYHDAMCVVGMNRIRGAYLQLAPDLEPIFVMGTHDDARGAGVTMGLPPNAMTPLHVLAATPSVVSILNSVIAAMIVVVATLQLGLTTWLVVVLGGVAFLSGIALHTLYGLREIRRGQAGLRPLFPTPESGAGLPD